MIPTDIFKNIILINAFGVGNLGDDLLLKAAIIKYGYKNVKLCVGVGEPQITNKINFCEQVEFFSNTEKYLDGVDAIIFAGGSIWSIDRFYNTFGVFQKAKNFNPSIKVYLDGIGLYNFQTEAYSKLLKDFLTKIDGFTVRDGIESTDVCKDCGYDILSKNISEDLVMQVKDKMLKELASEGFLYSNNLPNFDKSKINIGLSVGGYNFAKDTKLLLKYIDIIGTVNHILDGLVSFYCIPHVEHKKQSWQSCSGVFNAIKNSLDVVNILPFPQYAESLFSYYNAMDMVIANRLHSAILGTICNKKILCVASGGKILSFAEANNIERISIENTRYRRRIAIRIAKRLNNIDLISLKNNEYTRDIGIKIVKYIIHTFLDKKGSV